MEVVVDGKKRKLVFKDTRLEDAGEITCKTNKDSSSCHLTVKCKDDDNFQQAKVADIQDQG